MSNIQLNDERSNNTLQRVQKNDTTLTELQIVCRYAIRLNSHHGCGQFAKGDFTQLGTYVGDNTSLIRLFCEEVNIGKFCDGLRRNSSIRQLVIGCPAIYTPQRNPIASDGAIHEILNVYQENNNLVHLQIEHLLLQDVCGILATTLRRCTNLKTIKLLYCDCGISDQYLLPIIEAMSEHYSLEDITLSTNEIGRTGCTALSTLLGGPNCNVQFLSLHNNSIDSDCAISIAESLLTNRSLRKLILSGNPIPNLNDGDLCAFSKVVCNTSSINQSYLSNHTLENVNFGNTALWEQQQLIDWKRLNSLLELNKGTNKGHVAIKKILLHHPDFDIEQFYQWDSEGERSLKALPHLIDWFGRAKEAVLADDEARGGAVNMNQVENRKLTALYQFARDMPLLVARDESTGIRGGGG